jgi:hypothetical protein
MGIKIYMYFVSKTFAAKMHCSLVLWTYQVASGMRSIIIHTHMAKNTTIKTSVHEWYVFQQLVLCQFKKVFPCVTISLSTLASKMDWWE